jgi:hypothetical protein
MQYRKEILVSVSQRSESPFCIWEMIDSKTSLNMKPTICLNFVGRIYPIEFETRDTTDTDRSASYIDIHLEIYSEGRLRTWLQNMVT